MDDITVDEFEYQKQYQEIKELLPFGCSVGLQTRLARNYGEGLFVTISVYPLFDEAIALQKAGKSLEDADFTQGEINMVQFIRDCVNDSSRIDAKIVLSDFYIKSSDSTIPTLELWNRRKETTSIFYDPIVQIPLLSTGKEQSNMGRVQGHAGASKLITEQGVVIMDIGNHGRLLIPALA